MPNTFTWKTKFKSIIIVDGELFQNEYNTNIHITPYTANLQTQTNYFDRVKNLFEHVFANTITTWRDDPLYHNLQKNSKNRFIELPRPPYDQIMAAVCFCKANSILNGQILVNKLELSSWQGDGITYTVDKDSKELLLLDTPNWFSDKYKNFDPWWLRQHMTENLIKASILDTLVGTRKKNQLTKAMRTMLKYLNSTQRF
jgi:hypothetical protein